MEFSTELLEGKILKRYKRFLADIELDSGEVVTAHVANTGSMKTCWAPNWPAIVSVHNNKKRKLPYSLEMCSNGESWIGINTSRPNALVQEALENNLIKEIKGIEDLAREKTFGKSRFDFYFESDQGPTYLEVKNVTLKDEESSLALFPDAVTTRGQKHIRELMDVKKEGMRAILFFVVQREDVDCFMPAAEIDPRYAELLAEAMALGVEVLVYQWFVSPEGIHLKRPLPFRMN